MGRLVKLTLCLLLSIAGLGILSTPASANHWCGPLTVNISPTSAYVQEAVGFGITLYNGQSDSLDVTSISVKFSWDPTTWNWGSMTLAGYASGTNVYTETWPSSPGTFSAQVIVTDARGQSASDSVTITVQQADSDGDGVPDASDNCPSTYNANQADADGDGIGDVCDSSPNGNGGGGGQSGAPPLTPYIAILL